MAQKKNTPNPQKTPPKAKQIKQKCFSHLSQGKNTHRVFIHEEVSTLWGWDGRWVNSFPPNRLHLWSFEGVGGFFLQERSKILRSNGGKWAQRIWTLRLFSLPCCRTAQGVSPFLESQVWSFSKPISHIFWWHKVWNLPCLYPKGGLGDAPVGRELTATGSTTCGTRGPSDAVGISKAFCFALGKHWWCQFPGWEDA